jgi:hypothetical protein
MPDEMTNVQQKAAKAINSAIDDFIRYPDKYLTEDDVRCCIVRELMNDPQLITS